MNTQLQTLLEQQFLNKWILIPVAERDQRGRTIPNKYTLAGGHCTFIGENQLNQQLTVVIDGMPVQVKHINEIRFPDPTVRQRKN